MASGHIKGSARFTYTPDGDTDDVTHLLAAPLLDIEPVRKRRRFEWWNTDGTTRSVVNVGEKNLDIWATIRFENQPEVLTEMLRQALEYDVTLNYAKEESAEPIACRLVSIAGAAEGEIPLAPDPDRYGFGEYTVRVRLRAMSGDTWGAVL